MAIIKHRGFTVLTQEHCDKFKNGKEDKRYPVQMLDRNGYHLRYVVSLDVAKARIDGLLGLEALHKGATQEGGSLNEVAHA